MAGDEPSASRPALSLDGEGLRIGVICSRFNDAITVRLLDGARRGLARCGVAAGDVEEVWVAGAFEIPLAAKAMAGSGRVDAVVAVGAVIRGETSHYDLVSAGCARGIQEAQLTTGVPVGFGVLTTENLDQAFARSEVAGGHNAGEDAALAAVEMALLLKRLGSP